MLISTMLDQLSFYLPWEGYLDGFARNFGVILPPEVACLNPLTVSYTGVILMNELVGRFKRGIE